MAEFDRAKVDSMLDRLPPEKRADFLQDFKARGNTIKQAGPSTMSKAVNFVAEEGPPMAGAAMGAMASLPLATLAGPLAPLVPLAGAAMGAMGTRGLQRTFQYATGQRKVPSTAEAVQDIASTGAENAIGEGAGRAVGPAIKAMAPVGKAIVSNPLSRSIGEFSKESADRLFSRPKEIVSKLGDKEVIGERVYQAANKFKQAVSDNMDAAGEEYRLLINKVMGGTGEMAPRPNMTKGGKFAKNAPSRIGPGFRLDVQKSVGPQAEVALKESGYGIPNRLADKADGEKFIGFYNRINTLKSASADDVYWLQRDLTNALGESNSKTLNVHLGKLKRTLNAYMDKTLPEIREANAIYRGAAELKDSLSKIDGADDAAKTILGRYKAHGSEIRQAIINATKKLPGAKEALDELLDLEAAKHFSPKIASIPRTGFAGSLGIMAGSPAAAAAPFALAGASPRATAHAVMAAKEAAERASKSAGLRGTVRTGTSAALAALRASREKK